MSRRRRRRSPGTDRGTGVRPPTPEPRSPNSHLPTPAITGVILARNEERNLEDALRSLDGWTDQVILLDDGSTDRTAEIARRCGAVVIPVGEGGRRKDEGGRSDGRFDCLRNLAVEHATGDWIFFLDADERVPPRLGPILKELVRDEGDQFEGLVVPFKHYFCGKWMQHSSWGEGYCRAQLLKKGRFIYGSDLHSGVQVDGRTAVFRNDDPDLRITHLSYPDLHTHLAKLNGYTSGEAASMWEKGRVPSWQAMLAHFVHDWQVYYDHGRGDLDGMHGFVLAFFSAFYRFSQEAKLWELFQSAVGSRQSAAGGAVPRSVREMLEFMARVYQEGAGHWLTAATEGRSDGETEGAELPGMDWGCDVPESGTLIATRSNPGIDFSGGLQHGLAVSWSCCSDVPPGTTALQQPLHENMPRC